MSKGQKGYKRIIWRIIKSILFVSSLIILLIYLYFSSDRRQIWQIYLKFDTAREQCVELYDSMSPGYKGKNTKETFSKDCARFWIVGNPTLSMNWNKTRAQISPGLWNGGAVLQFTNIDGIWYLDGIVDWYYD